MIKIIFFSKYRECFGDSELALSGADINTVSQLIKHLQGAYAERVSFLADQKLIISVNQQLQKLDAPLRAGDVIAFYPPVTGG